MCVWSSNSSKQLYKSHGCIPKIRDNRCIFPMDRSDKAFAGCMLLALYYITSKTSVAMGASSGIERRMNGSDNAVNF